MKQTATNGHAPPAELLDRKLPCDSDAELMVLRYVATKPSMLDSEDLTADQFYEQAHREILAAIASLREDQQPIDIRHIVSELRESGRLDAIGGATKIADMLGGEILPASVEVYLAALRNCHALRQTHFAALSTIQAVDKKIPAAQLLADAKERLARIECGLGHALGDQPVIVRMDSVVPQRIEWFWPGRFALGKFQLCIGDPGEGKSLFSVDMTARATRGSLWPCSAERAPKGKVLLICCEDDPADTISPRLEAAGADLSQVHLLSSIQHLDERTGELRERMLNLQTDIPHLAKLLERGGYRLVILDTLTGFMGKADNNSSTDVRNALTPLSVLAAKHRVAIVGIQHLTKNSATAAKYRTNGSIGYNGLARSVIAIARDHDDHDLRLMASVKTNLGPTPATLGFRVRVNDCDVPYIEWLSKPIDTDADTMLAAPVPSKTSAKDKAAEWLKAFLSDGPVAVTDVFEAGEPLGHSEKSLRAAFDILQLDRSKTGMKGGWLWFLPEHAPLASTGQCSASSAKTGVGAGNVRVWEPGKLGMFDVDPEAPEHAPNTPEHAPQ